MIVSKQADTPLESFIHKTELYLDKVVETGDDQALFIASYLQGHFAVAAGQSQVQQMTTVAQLAGLMDDSLNAAFENNELDQPDQQQVMALWQFLLNPHTNP